MRALSKALGTIATAAGIVGGIALMVLMLTTVVDVTLRSTLNVAFLGVTEVTELGLVVVAAFGIAYCGWANGHIALEFGEQVVPPKIWRVVQVAVLAISALAVATVAYFSFAEAIAVHRRAAHTNLLQVAEYPFYAVTGLGFLTYAAILLYRAVAARVDHQDAGSRE